jgi:hypothetical protein
MAFFVVGTNKEGSDEEQKGTKREGEKLRGVGDGQAAELLAI